MSDKPSRLARLPIVVSVIAVSLSLVSTYLAFETQRETRQLAARRRSRVSWIRSGR